MAPAFTGHPRWQADLSRRLVEAALSYRYAHLTRTSLSYAKLSTLDWLGVTLAGAREPCAALLTEELASSGSGNCTVVGRTFATGPSPGLYMATLTDVYDTAGLSFTAGVRFRL